MRQGAFADESERESLNGHERTGTEVDQHPEFHFVTIEQFVFQTAYYTNFILRRLTRPRTVLFFRVIS